MLCLFFTSFRPLDFNYFYIDQTVIDQYIDSLKKINVNEFLILFTNSSYIDASNSKFYLKYNLPSFSFLDTTYNCTDMSFLFWREKEHIYFTRITNNAIYRREEVNDNIFLFENKDSTWISDDENLFKVVAPIQEPLNKIIIIYIINNKVRFFELGENVEFDLNKFKNLHREKWLEQIIKSIEFDSRNWKIQTPYVRK